uniref:SPOR domain-containing protein n=1 Tax=Geobacter metallireducens TaxID=28232 RepID=A0A831XEH5_GEOME
MNIEFDKEPGEKPAGGDRSSSRLLLLVLLLLVAVFGYLFYFTDLIKPRREAQAPEPVQTAQVKQPIPPRPEGESSAPLPIAQSQPSGATPPAAAVKQEPAKAVQEQKAPDKAQSVLPAPAKPAVSAAKKEPPEPVEPAKVPAAEKDRPKAAEPAKTAVEASRKPVPAKAGDSRKSAAAGPEKAVKPAAVPAKSKTAAAKGAAAKAPAGTAAAAAAKGKPDTAAAGEYTLWIGEYVVPAAMEKDKAKVRDAGLTPVVKEGGRKKEPMIRLFFGEFADQATARNELQRLRDATVDGFVLNEGGKYRVYAGSYFVEERAVKEQQRLEALGFRMTLRKASVTVPTLLLTAGKYGSRDEALKDAARLKKKGLAPAVVANGK